MMFFKPLIAAIAVTTMAVPALSQDRPIELSSAIQLVNVSEAGETLVAPVSVVPGDTLEFQTSYSNRTGVTVSDFTVVTPLPDHVTLTPASAASVEVSVDGGTVWGPLANLTVTEEDTTMRAATTEDVTHLRWVIAQMAPEAEGVVSYRATVK